MALDTVERLVMFAGMAGMCLGLPMGFVLGMLARVREPMSSRSDEALVATRDASTLRQRRGAL